MPHGRDELNDPAQLTAYALGQMTGDEQAEFEATLPAGDAALNQEIEQIRAISAALAAAHAEPPALLPSASLRQAVESRLASASLSSEEPVMKINHTSQPFYWQGRFWIGSAAAAALLLVAFAIFSNRPPQQKVARAPVAQAATPVTPATPATPENPLEYSLSAPAAEGVDHYGTQTTFESTVAAAVDRRLREGEEFDETLAARPEKEAQGRRQLNRHLSLNVGPISSPQAGAKEISQLGEAPANATPLGLAERKGWYGDVAEGLTPAYILPAQTGTPNYPVHDSRGQRFDVGPLDGLSDKLSILGTEQYDPIVENLFLAPKQHPLSTFSIDVDTASYANVRRFLNSGRLPPPSAVRIEELVNYFTYDYPQPQGDAPFSVNMEAAACPWQPGHLLLRVGLKGKEVHKAERPASNLVFLLDVSGSMSDQNKLPLLKTAMQMLVGELQESDRVTIVTYAGNAGLVLEPTSGHDKQKIQAAIEQLSPGGSTNGSAGIQLAYEQAAAGFLKEGTNRVILATDGDLNVGITSDEALVDLIKQKAAGGVFLTVLGFGEGNLKDAKMEKLADNGNGVYAYIDSVREARKVLVEQMSGSLVTIAKDVKVQIEFNPAQVASYRLLGYENRILAAEDFNNDKKDAGEIGAGHTVTALYELMPVGAEKAAEKPAATSTEPLRYQQLTESKESAPAAAEKQLTPAAASGELLTLKLRYKAPDGDTSKLLEYPLKDRGGTFNSASPDLQFAAAVASFGMILRGSEHRGSGNLSAVAEIAAGSLGKDRSGYRAEFLDLVGRAQRLGAN